MAQLANDLRVARRIISELCRTRVGLQREFSKKVDGLRAQNMKLQKQRNTWRSLACDWQRRVTRETIYGGKNK